MRVHGSKNKDVRAMLITYPATGFQSDVERLLQAFVATRSIRYEEYVNVWKSLNFSLVHVGRAGIRENREFLDEAFKVLVKYILPPYHLQVRVGGIYTIYGLYYTQKLSIPVRVRIPVSCWPDFCELRDDVTKNRHLDAVFIIRKMIADRVFMICAYPSMLSVDELYLHPDTDLRNLRGKPLGQFKSSGWGEETDIVSRLQSEDSVGQLSAVHEKYHQLKCAYNASRGGPADTPGCSFDLIKPNLANTILSIAERSGPVAEPEQENSDNDNNPDQRAQTLKLIKKKAQSAKAKTSRSLRYINDVTPEETPPDLSAWSPRKRGRPLAVAPPGRKRSNTKKRRVIPIAEKDSDDDEDSTSDESSLSNLPRMSLPMPVPMQTYSDDSGGDSDYEPDRLIEVTEKRKLPSRRSSTLGLPEEDLGSTTTDGSKSSSRKRKNPVPKKIPRASDNTKNKSDEISPRAKKARVRSVDVKYEKGDKDSSQSDPYPEEIEVRPNTFVVMKPSRRFVDRPTIGRVVSLKSPSEVEVIWFKGTFDSRWVQLTKAAGKEEKDQKIERQVIRRSQILMTFDMRKSMRIPCKVKQTMKSMYEAFEK